MESCYEQKKHDSLPLLIESQSQKKKRSGWWDTSKSKQDDMNRIKQMIQSREVLSRPVSEERKVDLRRVELEPIERQEGDLNQRNSQAKQILLDSPNIALVSNVNQNILTMKNGTNAKERTESSGEKEMYTWDENIRMGRFENQESHPIPSQEPVVAPAAEMTRKKKKKQWVHISGDVEFNQRPPTPNRPSTPKTSNPHQNHPYEPKTPPKPKQSPIIQKINHVLNESIKEVTIEPIGLFKHLVEMNMHQTAEVYQKEANIAPTSANYLKLYHYIENRDFGRAVVLVQSVLQSVQDPNSISSFEDLMYVLSKYLLIHLQQVGQIPIADRTLKMVIWPMVQKEQKKGGIRSEWFTKDYFLLNNLISESVYPDNLYQNLDWRSELDKFWSSICQINGNESPPLFAYALAKYFCPVTILGLKDYAFSHQKLSKIVGLLKEETVPYVRQHRRVQKPNPEQVNQLPGPPMTMPPQNTTPKAVEKEYEVEQKSIRKVPSEISSSANCSRLNNRNQDELPPLSHDPHNSNFALSKACGPLPSIRVMDVQTLPETGQIVAITAGKEKELAVWDVRENCILATLENSTVKPVVIVHFHPSFPELALSADMENDIKLWNWKESTLVRWWKKHHSRIIYQLGFIPGDDTKAVSCSGDQSLKMYFYG
jgi:hypothetical protein